MNSTFKNAHILIVDDKVANIELLEDLLEQNGYSNVKSTTDPRQVVGLVASFNPDIILLDLMMPYMSGFEVMEELNKTISIDTYIPILVLTAEISFESKRRALTGGAKDFLSKPFDLNEVSMRIRNLLETRYLYQLIENKNLKLTVKVIERTNDLEIAYKEISKANKELESLDKAKLEFLNIISHEIRTPLNGIKGFTEILKKRIDSPQLLEFLQYLEISAERLEKFSYQALLIAQLRTKKYELYVEEIPILTLLDIVSKKLKTKLDKKNIHLEFQKDADLFTIKADLNLANICFECLIDNAIKYSPKNEIILMNVYSENGYTNIEFIDKGTGFSQVALKNLYSFFGVGDKHIDENTGLNLALTKLIMKAHKGDINVSNNEVGATVKLIFKN
jgi:two-component system sensor histidine kinase/response regulator